MTSSSWMIARLNDETRIHHVAADADLDVLFHDDVTATHYLLYLIGLYGFEAPLEAALVPTPLLDRMVRLRERSRCALIAKDLMQIGLRPQEVAELPMCLAIPSFRGAAEALAWMYVVERATLVHSVIQHHLATRLPHEMAVASSYLGAYEGVVGLRWRQFGMTLDQVANHPSIADRIVVAANEAFTCQRRWIESERTGATARAAG